MSGFGKPKFGGDITWGRLKLKVPQGTETTHTIARLLPPYKDLAESGKWGIYCSVHFGFEGKDRQDPTKTSARPFECVEVRNMRTRMTTESCPQCEVIATRKEALKQKEATLLAAKNADGTRQYTDEDVKVLTKDLREWIQQYNIDRKWYLAAMTEDGKFHVLTISHTLKKVLENRIKELRALGIDPLDLDTGVWFDFSRQGQKLDTVDDVHAVMESIKHDGRVFQTPKPAPLTAEQITEALACLPSLNTVVTKISREQIAELANCSGDPEEVDAIFNMGQTADAKAPPKTKPMTAPKAAEKAPEPVKVEVKAAAPAPAPTPAAIDPEEAEEERQAAELAAKKAARLAKAAQAQAAAAPVVTAPAAAAPGPEVDFDTMDNAAFLAAFPDPSKA